MWQARVFTILARTLAVMVCWLILMGVPLLLFRSPLGPDDLKRFLGVFYALLLFTGFTLSRAWGIKGLLLMAFPFLVVFTALGLRTLVNGAMAPLDKLTSLNFFAIYGVLFLAGRLGARPTSPRVDDGKLM